MGQEIEYKLRAEDAGQLYRAYERLKQSAAAGPERVIEMRTCYFDTPDRRLRDLRWTLRIRQENDRSVLTCKTPGEGRSRGEWELTRTSDAPVPEPEELKRLCEAGAPEALCSLQDLRAVCGARFTRRCAMLELPDARIELAADTGELCGMQTIEPFFELELELYDGSAERLASLAEEAELPEETRSKQARAMALL